MLLPRLLLTACCTVPPARSRIPEMTAGAVDYLVVGAGASGMAFVDTLLLHKTEPVSVLLLDKRTQPGGHWQDAYDFATLHRNLPLPIQNTAASP